MTAAVATYTSNRTEPNPGLFNSLALSVSVQPKQNWWGGDSWVNSFIGGLVELFGLRAVVLAAFRGCGCSTGLSLAAAGCRCLFLEVSTSDWRLL